MGVRDREGRVTPRYSPVMVNARTVNGTISHFLPAAFCEFFADSGRFLRFKKSVKYILSSKLTVRRRGGEGKPGPGSRNYLV